MLVVLTCACPPAERLRCNVDADCGAGLHCDGGYCVEGERCVPAAEQPGDGVDQNCDGLDDCWVDADDDGAGGDRALAGLSLDCVADARRAAVSGDCADDDPARHPGAADVPADGVDQDCDAVDSCFLDVDGDGYGGSATVVGDDLDCGNGSAPAMSANALDCDDALAAVNPAGTEAAGNDVDENCDGTRSCLLDADLDGAGSGGTGDVAGPSCATAGFAILDDDCAADDDARYPGATEAPADGVDQDCDGVEVCFADVDLDGFAGATLVADTDLDCGNGSAATFSTSSDCDDADDAVFPGAAEGLADGQDADCDGLELCRVDGDADGFAAGLTGTSADFTCRAAGFARFGGDCSDASAAERPGGGCNDGDGCTTQDSCAAGACAGVPTTAGACCASSCPSSGCCSSECSQQTCPACSGVGQACALRCQGGRCPAQCSDGARCSVDATSGNNATLDCSSARCSVTGTALATCTDAICLVDLAAESTLSCRAGSLCAGTIGSGALSAVCDAAACLLDVESGVSVSCADGSLCELACPQGGCALDCTGASSCLLSCPGGACTLSCNEAATSCTSELTVCGRACP